MALDRNTILEASLALIDEEGLANFSLRSLGRRLGVSQMAAYRHFEDKAAILDALADRLLESVRLDDPDSVTEPVDRILGYCRRARNALLAHPDLAPVVAARPLIRGKQGEDLLELHQVFRQAGFPDDTIVEAVLTMMSVTLGLVLYEQQRAAYDASQGDRYREERARTLAVLAELTDVPSTGTDLVRLLGDGAWGEYIFETVLRDVFDALLVRAGGK